MTSPTFLSARTALQSLEWQSVFSGGYPPRTRTVIDLPVIILYARGLCEESCEILIVGRNRPDKASETLCFSPPDQTGYLPMRTTLSGMRGYKPPKRERRIPFQGRCKPFINLPAIRARAGG